MLTDCRFNYPPRIVKCTCRLGRYFTQVYMHTNHTSLFYGGNGDVFKDFQYIFIESE